MKRKFALSGTSFILCLIKFICYAGVITTIEKQKFVHAKDIFAFISRALTIHI